MIYVIFVLPKIIMVQGIKKILQKITLVVLFAAALNLSFHVSMPEDYEHSYDTGSVLSEQVFLIIPFSEKENNQALQQVFSLSSPLFSFNSQWTSLQKTKLTLELLFRQGRQLYREYPFVVSVRNLRI